jgi:phage tail sheath protein FI
LEVRDPSLRRDIEMAPSAHMAGIYARVDVERGVHKAPANEVIRGISRIAADVTKREQDMLNPRNINALRFFPGRGNRVWGARCVTSDASWKYINVRRLFIMIEESIDEGTQWVVFEPNDETTWARVRLSITNFLTTQWRSGALQGTTAAEAFFVKCDRTTMTQDDIDNGRLICVIGIAPVKPAEFVIFRIQQKTLDTTTN